MTSIYINKNNNFFNHIIMASWSVLKKAIANIIKTNGNQEITGQLLQNTLNNIISSVGENATFVGIAVPTTNPGMPDGPVFYFAFTSGQYSNFSGFYINKIDNVKIFKWDGTKWNAIDTGLPNNSKVTELVKEISDKLLSEVNKKVQELSDKVDNQKNEVDAARDEAIEAINDEEQNAISNFNAQRVTPEMLSESTLQLINSSGGGIITNMADDEDLYSTGGDISVLKFADKEYNSVNYSGLGRKYLRKNVIEDKNVLIQDMINKSNTRYIIQYDYDLNGESINIPENSILDFQGGSLSNGTIVGNNTNVVNTYDACIFKNLQVIGGICGYCYVDWFGALSYNTPTQTLSNSDKIQSALYSSFKEIRFKSRYYYCDKTLIIDSIKKISFDGAFNPAIKALRSSSIMEQCYCGCIWSDINIDILHIKVRNLYNATSSYETTKINIQGGCFDVSSCSNYSSSVISIFRIKGTNLLPVINTNIIGNAVISSLRDYNYNSIGLCFTEEDDAGNGAIYGGYINSYIGRFSVGVAIKNRLANNGLPWVTNITFNNEVDICKLAYDLGENGNRGGKIEGWIQSAGFFDSIDNGEVLIKGNFRNAAIGAIFWDLNGGSSSRGYSNQYAFDAGRNVEVAPFIYSGAEECFYYKTIKNYETLSKKFNDNLIIPTNFTSYGTQFYYIPLINNNLYAYTNAVVENSESLTISETSKRNLFKTGLFYTINDFSANDYYINVEINFPTPKNFGNLIVSTLAYIYTNNSVFRKVEIISYNSSNSVLSQETFINRNEEGTFWDYSNFYFTCASKLAPGAISKIVVRFSDLNVNSKAPSSTILIEGSFKVVDYSHICTRDSIILSKDGNMNLRGSSVTWADSRITSVYDGKTRTYLPKISSYFSDVTSAITAAENINYYRGAPIMINPGYGYGITQLFYNNSTSLTDSKGHIISDMEFRKEYGATSNRPNIDSVWDGFCYFDSTLGKPIWKTGSKWVDATGSEV